MPPIGPDYWQDTGVILPAALQSLRWRDVFTGSLLEARELALPAGGIFESFPVALLAPAD